MAIVATSGPASIIDSGMVTCFMGGELLLTIEDPVFFTVEFVFVSDPEIPDVAVGAETFDNRMRLTCVNFDAADGRGSSQPVFIGESGPWVVFLHFRVFLYGRTEDRTVHYTLYKAKKADVGWESTGETEDEQMSWDPQ